MSETKNQSLNWHAVSLEETLKKQNTDLKKGLSTEEAAKRKAEHGPNKLPEAQRIGPVRRFLLQFHNVLIYVLLASAVITALLDHWIDTWVIFAVVILNALIGFMQEGKAEKALSAISGMLSADASVTRDGETQTIAATELVPGDIVHLQSGDKVPADLRIVENRSLRVEEAALTGESLPVEKSTDPVKENAALGDRASMAYSGTIVSYGQAAGVVVGTGSHTEIGRINALVSAAPSLTTPLLRQVAHFGHLLTYTILGVAALVLPFAIFVRGATFTEAFLAVVGLAVAAIPEGLPAIMTITLAIGVQAMARRNAIIRRLPAVETLGSVSVICSDKTGTLTRNEMTVSTVVTADHLFEITGTGYQPEGSFSLEVKDIDPADHAPLTDLARVGLLCNDSRLRETDNLWRVEGDPTEGALLALGMKAKFTVKEESAAWPRLDAIPFESDHKFMATLHETPDGERMIFLKGAPERVLERCHQQRGADGDRDLTPDHWDQAMDHVARRGERLLALAVKSVPKDQSTLDFDDVKDGFVMLGLTGIIDPPRDESIEAIRLCHAAGVTVKMITGDHALTADAIAKQIGLMGKGKVISGAELEKVSDEDLPDVAEANNVFARTTPEHKLRLVKALQSRGHIVAMTGDGVNDAPALKTANVGIAMGIKGTEAAKEVSEMVLADDNFASITRAVEEGRTVYDNLKKAILFILPTNGAEALVIITAILLGFTMPLTPVQVLWVNMVTAVTLGLALAFEPPEAHVMRRPPRNAAEPLLPRFFLWRIGFVSVLIMLATLAVFFWVKSTQGVENAQTAAVGTLIFGQIFYLLNSRFMFESSLRRDLLTANPYIAYAIGSVVMAQMFFTYFPYMNTWFGSRPLAAVTWLPMLATGLLVFIAVEIEKAIIRKRNAGKTAS
ncbi:MAG: cation-transporting P-type ATPase [Verrucomicrobia bacterium]|nr:cation-transporting P-type ATPase [Verrucomicrobiota bacterium]MCH8512527.1 cation-transporting P-type ATPase [Kiritimatiellia bacterium]